MKKTTVGESIVTIYRSLFSNEPYYITVNQALNRIKEGASKKYVSEIRETIDNGQRSKRKQNLPSVCFSGKFLKERKDTALAVHSGFIVLDFDHVENVVAKKERLKKLDFIHACWTSPSGNGVKALALIADGKKHRQHFNALKEMMPDIDGSGINESRVCFESYDPGAYINKNTVHFKKTVTENVEVQGNIIQNSNEIFTSLLKWTSNKNNIFAKGNRNRFIFILAGALCRYGISRDEAVMLCSVRFGGNGFTNNEIKKSVESAYRTNATKAGTAVFSNEKLVTTKTRKEVEINTLLPENFDPDEKAKDVVYGEDVKADVIRLYEEGDQHVKGIGVHLLDAHFKMKRGEITLLTGVGNYGKSSFLKWLMVTRMVKFGEKFAIFAPEDHPAEEFYFDMAEVYLGCDCKPTNPGRPTKQKVTETHDLISKHVFFIYPKTIAPTPDYVKEKFFELIVKEKIDCCIIDPFNQLTNDWSTTGGRDDKYLEMFLSDFSRFASNNNVYFFIAAHPKLMRKEDDGNIKCPDVYDIAGGAMWNNKMDNILVYHKPLQQTDPTSSLCELHSKKIRRQKSVGLRGSFEFDFNRKSRRFTFDGHDVLYELLGPQGHVEAEKTNNGTIPF